MKTTDQPEQELLLPLTSTDMLRSIIIDDEPQNAEILKKDIAEHCPSVQIIAICNSAKRRNNGK
jgi:hypothetical protein